MVNETAQRSMLFRITSNAKVEQADLMFKRYWQTKRDVKFPENIFETFSILLPRCYRLFMN